MIMDIIHDFFVAMTQTPESIAALVGIAVGIIVVIVLIVVRVRKSKASKKK
jgi:uncharacterized integral membrane protein